ncbi:VWA domain-containing protein [Kitasatospora sp. NPDC088391]|uniref:VWA domain-containing protein n=1 Tax=Kitasatospora sp. NPDC088391 TaxID=3364074 RepID=UPI0038127B90
MTVRELAKGANLPIEAATVRIDLSRRAGPGTPEVAVTALLLLGSGHVRDRGDHVGAHLPRHSSGAVAHRGRTGTADSPVERLEVDLGAVEPAVRRIVFVAATVGDATFGQVPGLTLLLGDARTGAPLARFPIEAGRETALVCGELYRRDGHWKFRAVGQGYADGLTGLAATYGLTALPPAARPAPPVPPRPAAPPVLPPAAPAAPAGAWPTDHRHGPAAGTASGAGEEQLPVDMRKRLSLRKQQVAVSLRKHGAQDLTARVVLVLDASGSMSTLYARGVVADVVERMAAVAAQLDDDGEMQAWTFASNPARLPDLRLPELPDWLRLHVRVGELSLFGRRRPRPPQPDGRIDMKAVGIQNEEQKVIAEVREYVRRNPAAAPTLVLFFSDGGVYRNAEIERELRAAVEEPVFWQFVGLGRAGYGVLEQFGELPGRRVDNVGFFAVDDISTLPDPELYDRLLSEFPHWVTTARRAGILP